MPKHWYFKDITMCPICGEEKVELERRQGEKPEDINDRQEIMEIYDWCNE